MENVIFKSDTGISLTVENVEIIIEALNEEIITANNDVDYQRELTSTKDILEEAIRRH